MPDHYQTLGISPNATSGQIKVAYRRLALQYHPDKNPDDALAEKRFIEITKAYEVLSNTQSRNQYDRGINPQLESEHAQAARRRRPPHAYYQHHVRPKVVYTKRDYSYATVAVVTIIIIAIAFPMYLLQATSTRHYNEAISNYLAGQYYSALHHVDLSIKDLSSNNVEACALASVILVHRLEKYDYALKYINRGLDYHPEDSLASEFHYLKGICLSKLSSPNEALLEFKQVREHNSTYDSSLFRSAAILLFNLSEPDSAEILLDQLKSRNPQHYAADYLKGIVYEKRSEPQKAFDVFSELIDKSFNTAASYYHLAKSEIKLNLPDSACAHLEIASRYRVLEAQKLYRLYCQKQSVFMSP